MTTPDVPVAPVLTTVPRVELIEVGRWNISNMQGWEPTPDDLYAAVAALDCPAVRKPVLKLGHVEGADDPCLGWIANMAVAEDGHMLIGDYAGVPAWLAAEDAQGRSVLASAYPSRSCEGEYGYVCQLGHTHPFVLHAMALLGVVKPGIGTLQSLHDLYTTPPEALVTASAQQVAAAATTDDVRRAYYDGPGSDWDLWIEQLYVDPMELIVHNDATGGLTRVAYTVDADGAVAFTDPQPVKVQYVAARTAGTAPLVAYASHAEARPGQPPSNPASPARVPAAAGSTTTEEAARMADLLTSLRQSLGLAEDADEATVLTAHTEALAELERLNEAAGVTTTPTALPDGVVTIDQATLSELQVAAAAGREARAQQLAEHRTRTVDAAIGAGRIPPARRDHWLAQLAADPGAETVLASLQPGTVPVSATGYDGGVDVVDEVLAAAADINAGFPGLVLTPRES